MDEIEKAEMYTQELEAENARLQSEVSQLEWEVDSLRRVISGYETRERQKQGLFF